MGKLSVFGRLLPMNTFLTQQTLVRFNRNTKTPRIGESLGLDSQGSIIFSCHLTAL